MSLISSTKLNCESSIGLFNYVIMTLNKFHKNIQVFGLSNYPLYYIEETFKKEKVPYSPIMNIQPYHRGGH
jgi:hypothetical protein